MNKKILTDITVLTEAIKQVRILHSETEESEITNTIYCKECQYEYPCDTIKIVGGYE